MSEILLGEDQRRAIEEAMRWESEALARLGTLELRRRDLELELASAATDARLAAAQCSNVLHVLCAMLQLPPGEWAYDKATGQLTMTKEAPHA